MSQSSRSLRWFGFYLTWVFVTTLAWTIALAIGLAIVGWLAPRWDVRSLFPFGVQLGAGVIQFLSTAVYYAPAAASLGLLVGLGQWYTLRRMVKGAGWWFAPTVVGSALGFLVALAAYSVLVNTFGWLGVVLAGVAGGLAAVVWQFYPLSRWVRGAAWWLLVCGLAWAAVPLAFLLVSYLPRVDLGALFGVGVFDLISGAIVGTVSGLVIGVVGAAVMIALVAHTERHFEDLLKRRMASSVAERRPPANAT